MGRAKKTTFFATKMSQDLAGVSPACLYPSHGPVRLITSHSFRARLCHAKNEAPDEEAVTLVSRFKPWGNQNNNSFFLEKVKE